ncbi:MAG: adenine methyltransferase, partial [Elusimicrobiota bacterium]|nr:adenine methyltransferase [Elusimicrobiota bacterium]
MSQKQQISKINSYISVIDEKYRSQKATEHTYRPALSNLLKDLLPPNFQITNEPRRIECGAPDFIINQSELLIGYIECKDITVGIYAKENEEQIKRYKEALPNLIVTDYLTFELYIDGESKRKVCIARVEKDCIKAESDNFENFIEMLNNFAGFEGQNIYQTATLAKMMAQKARFLRKTIGDILKSQKSQDGEIYKQFKSFREVLALDLSEELFVDNYAQT